jgi:hypothetical protein
MALLEEIASVVIVVTIVLGLHWFLRKAGLTGT